MPFVSLVAVVSSDGKIADACDDFTALKSEPDTKHLLASFQAADLLLFARKTYEKDCKRMSLYRCAVMTTSVETLQETAPNHWLWNPRFLSFEKLCARLSSQLICLLGGSQLFTLARRSGWIDEMQLTYVPNVQLEGGIPLFSDYPDARIWELLKSGALGFVESQPPQILPGGEALLHPPQLRKYAKVIE